MVWFLVRANWSGGVVVGDLVLFPVGCHGPGLFQSFLACVGVDGWVAVCPPWRRLGCPARRRTRPLPTAGRDPPPFAAGLGRGVVLALRPARFPDPPAAPVVRVSTQRATHVPWPVVSRRCWRLPVVVVTGRDVAAVVADHFDAGCAGEFDSVADELPTTRSAEPTAQFPPAEPGVLVEDRADDAMPRVIIDRAGYRFRHPVRESSSPTRAGCG